MTLADAEAACVTVVEAGAAWVSRQVDDGVSEASDRILVAQQADETPAELALRAVRHCDALTRSGKTLVSGVVVASDTVSDDIFQARCQISRAMIRAMNGCDGARLIFAAPSTLSEEGRHELMAIAGTLTAQLRGTKVEVSVRFVDPSERSGTYRALRSVRVRKAWLGADTTG